MATTSYPNGQVLSSTALTLDQINLLIQTLTCGMIGINPPDPVAVRIDWPVEGQPDVPAPSVDVCYIACTLQDVEYSRVRDHTLSGDNPGDPVLETWVYTRGWRVSWQLAGPNAFDRARQIHSALFQDYFNDALNVSKLYPVPDMPEPVRIPVEHNAQWYPSSQFYCVFYEEITETIQTPSVTSVELKLYAGLPDITDPIVDITVPPN